jgi:hypothetical protein
LETEEIFSARVGWFIDGAGVALLLRIERRGFSWEILILRKYQSLMELGD